MSTKSNLKYLKGVIVSNHVSYLDILYHMSSSFPSFVAKRSVAKLTLVGIIRSPSAGSWSVPDLLNPYVTQGMKGHVKWPQGPKKQSLKAKLMEARIHSKKVLLCQYHGVKGYGITPHHPYRCSP